MDAEYTVNPIGGLILELCQSTFHMDWIIGVFSQSGMNSGSTYMFSFKGMEMEMVKKRNADANKNEEKQEVKSDEELEPLLDQPPELVIMDDTKSTGMSAKYFPLQEMFFT